MTMMTQWLSYVHLCGFNIKRIPGNKTGAAEGLCRREKATEDELDKDLDNYFKAKLCSIVATTPIRLPGWNGSIFS